MNFLSTKYQRLVSSESGWLTNNFSHWPFVFFALGLFGYTLRLIGYFSAVPGDFGDARWHFRFEQLLFYRRDCVSMNENIAELCKGLT